MDVKEIINQQNAADIIAALKVKTIELPAWEDLEKEYNPAKHPVITEPSYIDIMHGGKVDKVTRITYDLQRLSVKRTTELCFGVPVKRMYHPQDDAEAEIAKIIETIFNRTRIDSVNIDRGNMLFSCCEVLTLWYAVEEPNHIYGFDSRLKLRCKTFSPMLSDRLYPLFDEYGDLTALSIGYIKNKVEYFDTYTSERHLKWEKKSNDWQQIENEAITIGKIPAIYMFRPSPAWEDTSKIVYEMEWAMSRNGNYLRINSKPVFAVFADEEIKFDEEKDQDSEFRAILQYPQGSSAQYVTWEQAVENLKFYVNELRQSFFTQLQLPDWSYESMKSVPMSGESRKQMFIDAYLKVKDESGRLLEFLDREIMVIKAFMKAMLPATMHKSIDSLQVENQITPFSITDDKDTITNIMTATGGKPIMSQREGIENLGWSNDVDKTLKEIQEENNADLFESTL
jgi:hypothetical protein